MDAQTESELDTFGLLESLIQVSHGSKNSQPSSYCSLRIIFVSLGIAEIHQETIAQELGNMSVKTLDHFSTHGLIRTYHITPVFRVELAGEFRGIDQVAEHDGELTTFS